MKITQEGKFVRFQLYTSPVKEEYKMLFDFKVPKEEYEEIKEHIIMRLQEFKLDD